MNRKNILIIVAFFVLHSSCFPQKKNSADSLVYYIKNLSWNSFQLTPTYGHYLMLSNDAQAILNNATDTIKVAVALLNEIEKKEKAVTVHVLLSKIFEPQNNSFKESYIYEADSIVTVNYSYNTLIWQYHVKDSKHTIEPEAIKKIKEYWEKKLVLLRSKSTVKCKQPKKNIKALKRGL